MTESALRSNASQQPEVRDLSAAEEVIEREAKRRGMEQHHVALALSAVRYALNSGHSDHRAIEFGQQRLRDLQRLLGPDPYDQIDRLRKSLESAPDGSHSQAAQMILQAYGEGDALAVGMIAMEVMRDRAGV